jgi:hypothetical protein
MILQLLEQLVNVKPCVTYMFFKLFVNITFHFLSYSSLIMCSLSRSLHHEKYLPSLLTSICLAFYQVSA